MELGLLGEVVAHSDGDPVALGPARRRCVLAALALDAGQVVPSDVFADRVWGGHPPYRTKLTLASYVSRLRAALPGVVKQRSGGYVLDVERSTVDVHRFQELTARATGASLRLSRELGTPIGEAGSLNLLGEVAQRAGDLHTALEYLEAALAVRRDLDETYSISHNLMQIGDVKLALGDEDEAVRLWQEALMLTKTHNHEKDAEPLLERLKSVQAGTAP